VYKTALAKSLPRKLGGSADKRERLKQIASEGDQGANPIRPAGVLSDQGRSGSKRERGKGPSKEWKEVVAFKKNQNSTEKGWGSVRYALNRPSPI